MDSFEETQKYLFKKKSLEILQVFPKKHKQVNIMFFLRKRLGRSLVFLICIFKKNSKIDLLFYFSKIIRNL